MKSTGHRGIALNSLGRHKEALAACDEAVRLDPGHAGGHKGRGDALCGLARSLPGFRATRLRGRRGLGDMASRRARYEEALAAYDRAVRLEPGSASAHMGRCEALIALGRRGEALAASDEAVRLEPGNAYCHTSRAAALGNLGRPEEALAACDEAERLRPGDRVAADVRWKVRVLLGRPRRAGDVPPASAGKGRREGGGRAVRTA